MSVRFRPKAESVRRWGGWALLLGLSLGFGVAAHPPECFGERIGPLSLGPGRFIGIQIAPDDQVPPIDQRAKLRRQQVLLEKSKRTPENLRELGILALARDRPNEAVDLFEEALERQTAEPMGTAAESRLRTDLAAALLAPRVEVRRAEYLFRALDESRRAQFLSPQNAAASFNSNRALAALGLSKAFTVQRKGESASCTPPPEIAADRGDLSVAWASWGEGRRLYDQQLFRQSLEVFSNQEASPFPRVAACSAWMSGLLRLHLGRLTESLRSYRRALDLFEGLGDRAGAARVHNLLAENERLLGGMSQAWEEHFLALRSLAWIEKPGVRRILYEEAAATAVSAGWLALASYLHERAEDEFRANPEAFDSTVLPQSLRRRALIESDLGRTGGAEELLLEAEGLVPEIDSPRDREEVQGDLELARARVLLRSGDRDSAHGALVPAGRAITLAARQQDDRRRIEALILRSKASFQLGRLKTASEDLWQAASDLESRRNELATSESRLAVLAQIRAVYELTASIEASFGRSEEARRAFEMLRGWERPRELGNSQVTGVADLLHELPPGTAVLEFFPLDSELLVWGMTNGLSVEVKLPLGRAALSQYIHRWRRSWRHSPAEESRAGRQLSAFLVAPLAAILGSSSRLIIVAGEPLDRLPFSALYRDSTHRLVESHPIAFAAGAGSLASSFPAKVFAREDRRVLAFGNPIPDPILGLSLRALPGAEEEIDSLRFAFPTAEVYLGGDATASTFLSRVPQGSVLHVAAHGIGGRDGEGRLVLATDGSREGLLSSREIAALPLSGLDLVVLATCRSSGSWKEENDSAGGLAESFLAAGASRVVASMAPVGDRKSAPLFRDFYREIQAGTDPDAALQKAQLTAIHREAGNRHPDMNWALWMVHSGI